MGEFDTASLGGLIWTGRGDAVSFLPVVPVLVGGTPSFLVSTADRDCDVWRRLPLLSDCLACERRRSSEVCIGD